MISIINKKEEIAKGTMLFEYELKGGNIDFKPGQFFFVTLGEGLMHHFTIVNSPNEKGILSMATRMRDSLFKNTLKEMPIGSEVEVGRVSGDFTLPDGGLNNLVFIALGIGITPFVSMLRYIKEESLNFNVTLIYSDSDKLSMAFLDEMEQYAKDNPNFKLILTITKDPAWNGEKRHIDGKFLNDYLDNLGQKIYYISGPPIAVEVVSKSLEETGIDKSIIKAENFSGY